jgi:hypothetical protein
LCIITLYSIRNGIIKNRENNKNLEFNKKMGMLSKRTMKRDKGLTIEVRNDLS